MTIDELRLAHAKILADYNAKVAALSPELRAELNRTQTAFVNSGRDGRRPSRKLAARIDAILR